MSNPALPPGTVDVDVVSSTEHWNEYLLEDGTILRVKLVLVRAYRLENGNYYWLHQQVSDVRSAAGSIQPTLGQESTAG